MSPAVPSVYEVNRQIFNDTIRQTNKQLLQTGQPLAHLAHITSVDDTFATTDGTLVKYRIYNNNDRDAQASNKNQRERHHQDTIIVYIHGGGWIVGDLDSCDCMYAHLSSILC